MRQRLAVVGLMVAVLAGVSARAGQGLSATQPPPTGTGLIMGRVVEAGSDRPLPGVVVSLGPLPTAGATSTARLSGGRVVTDEQGRYVFRQVPAGRYALTAEMHGNGYSPNGFMVSGLGSPIGAYAAGAYGQPFVGGPLEPIDIREGQRLANMQIALFRLAAINGTVTDEAGEPLVDAVVGAVRLSTQGELLTGPTTRTDDRGRYRVSALQPGRYVVFVPQTQIMMPASVLDRSSAASPSKAIQDSISSSGGLGWPANRVSIGGHVFGSGSLGFVTNALAPRQGLAYQTTFYPAATSPDRAGILTVGAGDDLTAIDVQLTAVKTAPVSGVLFDAAQPAPDFTVHLLPQGGGDASLFETATSVTDAQGRFEFPFVPVGLYQLVAVRLPASQVTASGAAATEHSVVHPGMPGASAMLPIGVGDEGLANVALMMRPGITLKVQFEFVGGTPEETQLQKLSVSARMAKPLFRYQGMQSITAPVERPAGTVRIAGLLPGRYALSATLGDWFAESITVGGLEVADGVFDYTADRSDIVVRMAARSSDLSGAVRDAAGKPDPHVAVVVMPADRNRWADSRVSLQSFRMVRPSVTGAFSVPRVPPGDYVVAAVTAADLADWKDAGVLARIAQVGTSVHIAAGAASTVTLTSKVLR